jgi:hypothetical protein
MNNGLQMKRSGIDLVKFSIQEFVWDSNKTRKELSHVCQYIYGKTTPIKHIYKRNPTYKTVIAAKKIQWEYSRNEMQQQNNDVPGSTEDK